MRLKHLLVILGICMAPLVAQAQWQWIDSQGKKVFSDQGPPPSVPDKNILKRPDSGRAAAPASAPTSESANASDSPAAAASNTSKPNGTDKALEEKARQAEEQEKAKRAAEEQRVAQARAESCSRAKHAQATFNSGMRVSRLNEKGEREVMSDEARAAEQRRLQSVLASDCGPMKKQ